MTHRRYGDPRFQTLLDEPSRRSAERVLPWVMEWINPASVVDVGCGRGGWLAVFSALGVRDVLGFDGHAQPDDALLINRAAFQVHDFETGAPVCDRAFDLAVSLEVAEHLTPDRAAPFVAGLTRLAPVVLFSAAIPHQGGTRHLNEQWPAYWAALFARENYRAVDALRPRLWDDPAVSWWYAQNMLLFVREDRLKDFPALARIHAEDDAPPRALVHPGLWIKRNAVPSWPRRVVRKFGRMVGGAKKAPPRP